MTKKILEGKLLTYSEQGMEGGVLCFQDINYIKLGEIASPFGINNEQIVWDKNDTNRIGIISNIEFLSGKNWLNYYDPITKDEDYKISSLYCGESKGDLEADKRLSEKYNFRIKYSVERLNENYGIGNWELDKQLPNVILKDGTKVHFGDSPTTVPQRPYGIPQDAQTRVSVKWENGITEHKKLTKELLVERWDYKGLLQLNETDYLKVYEPDSKKIINEGQLSKIPLQLFSQTFKGHFEQIKERSEEWETYFTEKYIAELHREIK